MIKWGVLLWRVYYNSFRMNYELNELIENADIV